MEATFSTQGSVDLTGEYFQAQGTNGRSCATCHTPGEAWSITPSTLQNLFDADSTRPLRARAVLPQRNRLDARRCGSPPTTRLIWTWFSRARNEPTWQPS